MTNLLPQIGLMILCPKKSTGGKNNEYNRTFLRVKPVYEIDPLTLKLFTDYVNMEYDRLVFLFPNSPAKAIQ